MGTRRGRSGEHQIPFLLPLDPSCFLQALLDHGADVDALNNEGQTPLHISARWGRTEVVRVGIRYSPFLRTQPFVSSLGSTESRGRCQRRGRKQMDTATVGGLLRTYEGRLGEHQILTLSLYSTTRVFFRLYWLTGQMSTSRTTWERRRFIMQRIAGICRSQQCVIDLGLLRESLSRFSLSLEHRSR